MNLRKHLEQKIKPNRLELIEEAANLNANTKRQADLIARLISKRLGTEIFPLGAVQAFKNKRGNFYGFQYFYGDTASFRLNLLKGAKTINSFDSIDVWDDGASTSIDKPDYSLLFEAININMQIPLIVNFMKKTPKFGKEIFIDNKVFHEESVEYKLVDTLIKPDLIEEGRSVEFEGQTFKNKTAAIEYMSKDLGYDRDQIVATGISPLSTVNIVLRNIGAVGSIKISKPVKSTIFDDTPPIEVPKYADVDELFDDLDTLTGMVIDGTQNSLIISGFGGTGKCVYEDTKITVEM